MLEGAGVEVVAKTSSPHAALAAVESLEPDLLVTELETADRALDGLVWLRRAVDAMPCGKAIVLSRRTEQELIDAALHAGAAAYVIKTAGTDDLAAAVRQVFEHSVYLGPQTVRPTRDTRAFGERHDLTARELEILQLLVDGRSNAQLAQMLWVTEQTVKFHLSNIYRKLGVTNRVEASRMAQRVED